MNILYFSLKGGVGKSSIALNHALIKRFHYVTNDIVTNIDKQSMKNFHQIAHNTKRIPKKILSLKNAIFDFGAMSNVVDAKVTQAVLHSDVVIIPTLSDERSLQATIHTYELIKENAQNIIFIINNYRDSKKFEYAYQYITSKIQNPIILDIRTTTLFERVAKDGTQWFEKINNHKGEYQLKKTLQTHKAIYETIDKLTKVNNVTKI